MKKCKIDNCDNEVLKGRTYCKQHYNEYRKTPTKETFIGKFNEFEFTSTKEDWKYLITALVNLIFSIEY